jgi:hypothetical protein
MLNYETFSATRFCLPNASESLQNLGDAFNQSTGWEVAYSSIETTYPVILGSLGFAFIISFFFSWVLQHCAGVVVAICVIGFYVGAGFLGFISYKNFKAIDINETDPVLKAKRRFFQISMFTIIGVLSIVSCALCCFWSQIKLATQIIGVRFFNFMEIPLNFFKAIKGCFEMFKVFFALFDIF